MMNQFGGSFDNEWKERIIVGVVIAITLTISWFFYEYGTGIFSYKVIPKVILMVRYNISFWICITIAIGFGIWNKIKHPDTFTWLELPVQVTASAFIIFLCFYVFFYTSSNVQDTEIWNGHVGLAEYGEKWTEEYDCSYESCSGSGDDRTCTTVHQTCYTDHPPYWKILTSNGEEVSTSSPVYAKYVSFFDNEIKTGNGHSDQSSVGDGKTFQTRYKGEKEKYVPTAHEHSFVNYMKASSSIKKRLGNMNGYEKFIVPYPRVYEGTMGNIELNRVIVSNVQVDDKAWAKDVDTQLDVVAANYGVSKEVNLLVYLVGTEDQGFLHALEEAWINGKKNDVVVLIGTSHFPDIKWVSIMSWTEAEEFKINLRNKILDLKDLTKKTEGGEYELTNVIREEMSKPDFNGGFKRKRMRDLEYLISGIQLPVWCQILIVLVAGSVSWFISYLLVNNEYMSKSYYKNRF
ncbi:MAG: hypothetical protein ACD_71C00132G0007 [uncultured bacterium (gcode 4)]|uniref:Uncharacterized protein n=1 Tax=uncultured bacterium (gcode 4) TaxID=1234023 RepID=K1YN90_9BACT|nr:MAG: hypothetical protein ACD_71C00132G0007 [uncultured bacterium (gcode 4)]